MPPLPPDRWTEIDAVFEAALDVPPSERAAFLEEACGGDEALRAAVATLLSADEAADDFAETTSRRLRAALWEALDDDAGPVTRLGPYRIVRELGHGGMGTVYLGARDDGQFEQEVALKLLRPGLDRDAHLRRFLAERQILASLQHPNIARLLEGGVGPDGRPYLAMEYIEGEPLDVYCDRHRLPVRDRLELFLTVCEAVQYAHRNLVVHRDLKPSNILVTDEGRVKLLDFGIAKLIEPDGAGETQLSGRLMTPEYASPEQVQGAQTTTAADVYQLGLLLYALLTGSPPYRFTTRSYSEVERLVCETDPPPPSRALTHPTMHADAPLDGRLAARRTSLEKLRRQLRGDLDTIVLKALRKEPERRYVSAEHLADDLRRHLGGRPVRARKSTAAYRVGKFVRRHRVGVAATAVILALLAGYAVTVTQQAAQIRLERDRAQRAADRAEQVTRFLTNVFTVSDPSTSQGATITADELLDAGAARLDDELADQPDLRAAMAHTIGNLYRRLGLYDDAHPMLEKAVALRRALYDGDHEDLASSLDDMASMEYQLGAYPDAESLYLAALDMRERLFGPDHLEVANTLNNYANMLSLLGRLEESAAYYERALAIHREQLGLDHPFTVTITSNLGGLYQQIGRYAVAETLLVQALVRRTASLGPDHPDVATSRNRLAMLYYEEGQLAQAEPLFREALASRRRTLGPEHPRTLISLNDLAALLYAQGKYADAEPLFREALTHRRRLFGPGHEQVAQSLNNLAATLRKQDRLDEAEPLYRESLAITQASLGDETLRTATALGNLGLLLRDLGRLDDAEPLLQQALAVRVRLLPDDHPLRAQSMLTLGACLRLMQRYGEAEPLLKTARAYYLDRHGADHPAARAASDELDHLYARWTPPTRTTGLRR